MISTRLCRRTENSDVPQSQKTRYRLRYFKEFPDDFRTSPHRSPDWRTCLCIIGIPRICVTKVIMLDIRESDVHFSIVNEDIVKFDIFDLRFSDTLCREQGKCSPVCTYPSSLSTFNASSMRLETYFNSSRFRDFLTDALKRLSLRYFKTMVRESNGSSTSLSTAVGNKSDLESV